MAAYRIFLAETDNESKSIYLDRLNKEIALPDMEKVRQEQASLVRIPDSFKKIIVVGGNSPVWRNEEGITIMGIFGFLLNDNSLEL